MALPSRHMQRCPAMLQGRGGGGSRKGRGSGGGGCNGAGGAGGAESKRGLRRVTLDCWGSGAAALDRSQSQGGSLPAARWTLLRGASTGGLRNIALTWLEASGLAPATRRVWRASRRPLAAAHIEADQPPCTRRHGMGVGVSSSPIRSPLPFHAPRLPPLSTRQHPRRPAAPARR